MISERWKEGWMEDSRHAGTCYLEELALHHLAHIPRAEEPLPLVLVEHLLVGCGVVAVACHDAGTRCSDLQ